MGKDHVADVSGTVGHLIKALNSLPSECHNWWVTCCGCDDVFMNLDASGNYLIFDTEKLF